MYVKVEAEIRPTEDIEKVVKAVRNVFAGRLDVVDKGDGYYTVMGESYSASALKKLHELLRIHRILDAARKNMLKGVKGDTIVFKLHKQAAYMNKVSFVDTDKESPLGAITFIIKTSDPERLIDWLAPRTSMGKPLWEIDMPED